ncbi:MAG: thiosulfate sulfurtransferase [Candidatus Tectomicrobia bacterium]|uniref:Thiosulfate sulfurtransferase n=1 Tax=Tectimicrobiota bacterium TaxID=2528274 RepID=A0A938B578_UNCTE|nr:thiosulfate sulfurtransferase [Candidatus Tectomicrobia bacterium]
MTQYVDATAVKKMITDGAELALLDVREDGQFGEGHMLLAVPMPYSHLEARLATQLPRRSTRTMLVDDGDGVAERAAARMDALGYTNVAVMSGGVPAWGAAGYVIFKGVNVPSKAFGEVVEHAAHTPSISADELHAMFERGENVVVVDGRTPEEFHRMNIPHGMSVPNAELVYRIHDIAPAPETTVVVNCAGRTRSIIGAQTLLNAAIPNKVVALRAGTMGWSLAGYTLERGSTPVIPEVSPGGLQKAKATAARMADAYGIKRIDLATIHTWQQDTSRSLYLLDVRGQAEYAAGHLPGAIHAPGGQLVQATDAWVAARGARIVLTDDTEVRAITTAHWLVQMGWDVAVLRDGIGAAGAETGMPSRQVLGLQEHPVDTMAPRALADALQRGEAIAVDVDHSMDYRKRHLPGALWAIRPRLSALLPHLPVGKRVVLYSEHETRARLAAIDWRTIYGSPVAVLAGGREAWVAQGLPVESSPSIPPDSACIDYLFFVHDRHQGNQQAMRDYLSWEEALPGQIAADGDATFNVRVP